MTTQVGHVETLGDGISGDWLDTITDDADFNILDANTGLSFGEVNAGKRLNGLLFAAATFTRYCRLVSKGQVIAHAQVKVTGRQGSIQKWLHNHSIIIPRDSQMQCYTEDATAGA